MYRTYFWEVISKKMKSNGFEIAWIVQNHYFSPDAKEVIKIPYPKYTHLESSDSKNKSFSFIKSTDRIINYFDGSDSHYTYYHQEFAKALDDIKPDLVIGESTLFHELIIIDICKRSNIPYLHPSSSSYPPKRFSFFQNDSKIPFGGEEKEFDSQEYDTYIDAISNRKIVPEYMQKQPERAKDTAFPKHKSFQDKANRIIAYIKGERFNTPSPLKKLREDKKVQHLLEQWNNISINLSNLPKNKKIILYPLQMQPEANLDVWGNKYRDQAALLQDISKIIPENWILVVKTNPKSKYEMTTALLQVIESKENVYALSASIPMKDIFLVSNLIITVTGTIAIEAVLSNKPLALFGQSVVSNTNGVEQILKYGQLQLMIEKIEKNYFQLISLEDKRKLIHKMFTTSYSGVISDPVSNPKCLNEDNLALVENAFLDILKKLSLYK